MATPTMTMPMPSAGIHSHGQFQWPVKETHPSIQCKPFRSACVNSQLRQESRLHVLQCQRRPNHNPDDDYAFDDLIEKYGKVIYKKGVHNPNCKEQDDDAESLSVAVALAKAANDVKAADILILFVKPLVHWTSFFIIVTAFSRPQIDAIMFRIKDAAGKKFRKMVSGDNKVNSWTLLDFGDVVVHIFLPEKRAFYNLEEFYGNAIPIHLPFDTPPVLQS